jgi:hypothetical protein
MSDAPDRENDRQPDEPDSDDTPDTAHMASDTEHTAPDADSEHTAPDADSEHTAPDAEDEQGLRGDVERYVRYLLVAGFSLLALIAMLRFYFAASATIDTWIADDYRSLFQALFNFAILLVAVAGVTWQARKIR